MRPNNYVRKYDPEARKMKYEHRIVMERELGRALRTDEHVHHKNGVKYENNPSNLQVLSASEHSRLTKTKYIGCRIRNCDGKHLAMKLCAMHYRRKRRKAGLAS